MNGVELRQLWKALPLYLTVGLSGVITIISIPVMINASGVESWAQIGVGQAVGGVAAALIAYGWGVTGPAAIARGNASERLREYRESLKTRALVATFVLPACVAVALTITQFSGLADVTAGVLSAGLMGLAPTFFFIGTGQLWTLFLAEALPRILGTLAGILLLTCFPPAFSAAVVPSCTALGILISVGAGTWVIGKRHRESERLPHASLHQLLVQQRHGVLTSIAGGVYLIAPTAIVGWIAQPALSSFVFYDKVIKQVTTLLSPVFNVLQGWVPRGTEAVARRARAVLVGSAAFVLVSMVGAAAVGPWLSSTLSAHEVHASVTTSLIVGLVAGLSFFEMVAIRVVLVAVRKVREAAWITVVGTVGGLAAVIILTPLFGTDGALVGVALGYALRGTLGTVAFVRS